MTSEEQRELIRETALAVSIATKTENSGLIQEMKSAMIKLNAHLEVIDERHKVNTDKIIGIEEHLKNLNSKTAKHSDLLHETSLVLQKCTDAVSCIPAMQDKIDAHTEWQKWATGITIAAAVFIPIVASLIVYIYQAEKGIDRTVQASVDTALSKYEITYEKN